MNIAKLVKKLVQTYGTNNPCKIAESKQLRIKFYPMPDGIRGIFVNMENREIFINSNLSSECQRAMVAIQLGYYIWRKRIAVNPFGEMCIFFEKGPMSVEPLVFAAHLLLFGSDIEEEETKEELSLRTGVPVELVQLIMGQE